jgi:hypothetical protein
MLAWPNGEHGLFRLYGDRAITSMQQMFFASRHLTESGAYGLHS